MKHSTAIVVLLTSTGALLPWSASSETLSDPESPPSVRRISLHEFPVTVPVPLKASAPDEATDAPGTPSRLYGFGIFAAGRCNHDYAIFGGGGGVEAFPLRRLGIGGDLGYYQFVDDVAFGLFMANVSYHFGERGEAARADPFVSASPGFYTSGDDGSGGAFGFGGGLNYWLGDRAGLHLDVRIAALGTEEAVALFRVGVSFR